MDKELVIHGKLIDKNGKKIVATNFFNNPKVWDVPIEELFEDFEDKGIFLRIQEKKWGKSLYEGVDWNTLPYNKPHPNYRYCSNEGKKKFLDMKFGMMIHWGFYSVLGIPESWPADATRCDPSFLDIYYTLWQVFNPTEFNADEWAELAKRAGMQFFQFTTKHHDGFCMYDTKTKTWARKRKRDMGPGVGAVEDVYINYSIMDTMFKRDIVGELVDAFRKKDLGIGFYFSHIDWNDPNFRWDKSNRSFDPEYGPDSNPEEWKAFIAREKEQLREILSNYGKIDQLFFDGTWFGLASKEMEDIILMCRKLQPDCMFSDRGLGIYGDFTSPERWIPVSTEDNRLKNKKIWQVCDPIHTSWAWLPDDEYKPKENLLHNFVDAIAKGGTYVFAIAPMSNGKFPQKTIEILEFMGDWLNKNGDAIYSTRPWKKFKEEDRDIYYTASKDMKTLNAIIFEKIDPELRLPGIIPEPDSNVILLGTNNDLEWKTAENNLIIKFNQETINALKDEIAVSIKISLK
ncbi:MAG: alpha-L-fucosidase [Promethearchaeota archaeon]